MIRDGNAQRTGLSLERSTERHRIRALSLVEEQLVLALVVWWGDASVKNGFRLHPDAVTSRRCRIRSRTNIDYLYMLMYPICYHY